MTGPAFFRRLGRDCRGTSITELALISPLFVLFVTGLIDLGQGLSERFTMQQAVNRTLEIVQAGPLQGDAESNGVDYSFLVTEAAAAAQVQPSNVTMRRWLECDNAPQNNYDGDCDVGAETARYLELRIDKPYNGHFFLRDYPMRATGAVRIQ